MRRRRAHLCASYEHFHAPTVGALMHEHSSAPAVNTLLRQQGTLLRADSEHANAAPVSLEIFSNFACEAAAPHTLAAQRASLPPSCSPAWTSVALPRLLAFGARGMRCEVSKLAERHVIHFAGVGHTPSDFHLHRLRSQRVNAELSASANRPKAGTFAPLRCLVFVGCSFNKPLISGCGTHARHLNRRNIMEQSSLVRTKA